MIINEKSQIQLSIINFIGTIIGVIGITITILMFFGVIPVRESSAGEYVTMAEFQLNASYMDKRIDENGIRYYQLQRSIERIEKKLDDLLLK